LTEETTVIAPLSFTGRGITSRRDVTVGIELAPPGHGVVFRVSTRDKTVDIPATGDFVVNTLRNVTLGRDGVRLCIVEHLLAAAALWGLEDLLIKVDGPEIPLGDGSARIWIDLFRRAGIERRTPAVAYELKETIVCKTGDRFLMASPDDEFSASYAIDFKHPMIGKSWFRFDSKLDPMEIADARTFGSLAEHEVLGIADQVVSMSPDGFSHPLRFADEPVRHKVLDLIGDIFLSGVNPMAIKATFVSMKAGHELDVVLAKKLQEALVPINK